MPKYRAGGPKALQLAARWERAFEMRRDGYTIAEIGKETRIDPSNLSVGFRAQLEKVKTQGAEELRAVQNERTLEVLRTASEIHRQFIPAVDSRGRVILVPAYDENGQPLLDENGQQVVLPKRDESTRLNALNTSIKAIDKISQINGCDAPAHSVVENIGAGLDHEITFNVCDAGARHPSIEALNPAELELVLQFIRDNNLGTSAPTEGAFV
jgi:hypothetical protein